MNENISVCLPNYPFRLSFGLFYHCNYGCRQSQHTLPVFLSHSTGYVCRLTKFASQKSLSTSQHYLEYFSYSLYSCSIYIGILDSTYMDAVCLSSFWLGSTQKTLNSGENCCLLLLDMDSGGLFKFFFSCHDFENM